MLRRVYNEAGPRRTLRSRVLRWYRRSGRDLPWRRTRDPYAILVSEVMLQQTQVSRVLPAYRRFLRRFPTPRALARAPLGDVLREWSGMGYNRRARDLHRAARLCRRGLPPDRPALDALPGIGAYTAGAVACFAFGERAAFADTNIRRVLGRIALGRTATDREAHELDAALMPRDAAAWHHALMDLGATICTARSPRCDACPVAALCCGRGRAAPAAPRRQVPFASSDRRVRGRIVALLRERPRVIASLTREIGDDRVARLVGSLEAEGLVERAGGRVRLPA